MAVFTNYDGGEFCSGLLFGSNGASMLTNIAKTLMSIQKVGASGAFGGSAKAAPQASSFQNNNKSLPGNRDFSGRRPGFKN